MGHGLELYISQTFSHPIWLATQVSNNWLWWMGFSFTHAVTRFCQPWSCHTPTFQTHTRVREEENSPCLSAGELILIALIGSKMFRGTAGSTQSIQFFQCKLPFGWVAEKQDIESGVYVILLTFQILQHFIMPRFSLCLLHIIFKLSVVMQVTNNSTVSDKRLM